MCLPISFPFVWNTTKHCSQKSWQKHRSLSREHLRCQRREQNPKHIYQDRIQYRDQVLTRQESPREQLWGEFQGDTGLVQSGRRCLCEYHTLRYGRGSHRSAGTEMLGSRGHVSKAHGFSFSTQGKLKNQHTQHLLLEDLMCPPSCESALTAWVASRWPLTHTRLTITSRVRLEP